MTFDASYNEQNRASTERIRALIARLFDEEMQIKVGEHLDEVDAGLKTTTGSSG